MAVFVVQKNQVGVGGIVKSKNSHNTGILPGLLKTTLRSILRATPPHEFCSGLP